MNRTFGGMLGVAGALFLGSRIVAVPAMAQEQSKAGGSFTVSPIGSVKMTGDRPSIVLEKQYQPGILGLREGSHIYVYWWFDRNDTPDLRATLQIHPNPPGNMAHPLTGVFACRSPYRPNLIGMTLAKVLSVKENVIEIDAIDAFADTPVLDVKPYSAGIDSPQDNAESQTK